ncbi:MAG: hypothetical protein LBK52_01195, partial [Deltaproteobacteria bacterium]|nr:hypothetical protein [Deltaproteobacteria bacterium]
MSRPSSHSRSRRKDALAGAALGPFIAISLVSHLLLAGYISTLIIWGGSGEMLVPLGVFEVQMVKLGDGEEEGGSKKE